MLSNYFPRVGFLVIVFLLLASAGALFFSHTSAQANSLEEYAAEVLRTCANDVYRPACYDEEIPKLLDEGVSYQDVFAVTALVQDQDSEYWYCHVLGHNVSAKETAKDVSKWTEVVARAPQGVCSNGAIHGAFQERFREELVSDEELQELIPEIQNICSRDGGGKGFTGLEQASCYHALGHLTMYITNGDINRATQTCDVVAHDGDRDFAGLCYDGAYMQIFQPLDPEDVALVEHIAPTTQEEAIALCNTYSGQRRNSCLLESWPLFIDEIREDVTKVESFCNRGFTQHERSRCFNGIFFVLAAHSDFTPESITSMCSALSDPDIRARCYGHSASRFLETDHRLAIEAAAVCKAAEDDGVGQQCYEEILFYSSFNYHKNTEPFLRLCAVLPEQWANRCLNADDAQHTSPFFK